MENEFRDQTPSPQGAAAPDAARASEPNPQPLFLPGDALALLPVRGLTLFPGMVAPITLDRDASIRAAQDAARAGRQVGVILQKDPKAEQPAASELHATGTVANILRYVTTPEGAHHVITQGVQRFRIIEMLDGYPFPVARVQRLEDPDVMTPGLEARLLQLKARAAEIIELLPNAPQGLAGSIQNLASPAVLADLVASLMEIKPEEKQDVLETVDVIARVDKVLALMAHQIEVLRISRDIHQQTQAKFGDRQREAVLREQLRTIQQQLGEDEGNGAELDELAERIDQAKMPEEADKQARKELKRLAGMSDSSGEYSMVRTYLDWMADLPWSASTEDRIDIAAARAILDEDHYGLEKIKRRILEYLAVRKLNPTGKSPVLCFAGPPGVGKTSLGQSIAKATGRKFVRLSMGGVHDEAEIRGHRRTYIGAMPGNIVQALRKAGSNNCVMMLDEVDKLGSGAHGDPAAALLEVLDPEQHDTFRDNYLGVPFDLSKVLFIATANTLDTIPGPLRDRMEIISLPGYTQEEKAQIARRYLVRRQLDTNGLTAEQCEISDEAIRQVIDGYTREAGVRSLEREIGSLFRHVAMSVAEGTAQHVRIEAGDLAAILGARRFDSDIAMRQGMPGVATGLAWTPVGGDILFIEASKTPGNGRLTLTGQLGEVMRESVQAALTLIKSRAAEFGIDPKAFEQTDIHVHVPAGAIPKDGPSAGVAMFSALTSLMRDTAVPADHAMTGEISLRGLVLPVGGIKEKVLAALRAGIKTVMLPARNERDLDDIPEDSRKQLRFVLLETLDDAVKELGLDAPVKQKAQAGG